MSNIGVAVGIGPDVEGWSVFGVATRAPPGRCRRLLELLGGQHGVQTGGNLGITGAHLLLHKIVMRHGLRQGKHMLLTPMAVEGFGNRLHIMLTASVAMP